MAGNLFKGLFRKRDHRGPRPVFLDRVVTKVIELDNGTATVFSGNYSAYSDKKAMLRDAQIRAYLNQQQEIRHQEAVIAKLKSFNRENPSEGRKPGKDAG